MRRRTIITGLTLAAAAPAALAFGSQAFAQERIDVDVRDPGTGTDGHEIVGLERPSSSGDEDSPADNVPPGFKAGDAVWMKRPNGQHELWRVMKRPSWENVAGYAHTGATLGAVGKLWESRLKGENVVQQATMFLVGGVGGFAVGALSGGLVSLKDPVYFTVPDGIYQIFTGGYFPNPNVGLYDLRLGPLNWR